MRARLSLATGGLTPYVDGTRRWPRLSRRLHLQYRVDHPHWQRGWRAGFTTDAGPHGMRVTSGFVPPQGSKLQLRIEVPGMDALDAWGMVAWNEPANALGRGPRTQFGVQLTSIPEAWFHYFAASDAR